MRKLLTLAAVLGVAGASLAAEALGIDSTGNVYRIDDTTGAEAFVNNVGVSQTFCLGYRFDDFFYTIAGGNLYKFRQGQQAVLVRSLPFLLTGTVTAFAISRGGVGFAVDRFNNDLWRFGTGSGETLVGNVGFPVQALSFNADDSLYCVRDAAAASLFGLYVINQSTCQPTRITTGDHAPVDLRCFTARPVATSGISNFLGCFNTTSSVNTLTGTFAQTGGSLSSIRGVAYRHVGPFRSEMDFLSASTGRVDSNSATCLDDRDRNCLRVCKFIVPNQFLPPIRFTIVGTPILNPATLALLLHHRATSAGAFRISVDFLVPRTGTFDQVGDLATTTAFTNSVFVGDPARHIANNGDTTVRVSMRPVGPVANPAFCVELDQAVLQST